MDPIYLFRNSQSRIEKKADYVELRLATQYSKKYPWLLEIPIDFMVARSCIFENLLKNITLEIHSVDTLIISSNTYDERYGTIIHAIEETIKMNEDREVDIAEEYTDISMILNIKFYNKESGDLIFSVEPGTVTLSKSGNNPKKIELHDKFKPIPMEFEDYKEIVRLLEFTKTNFPTS